MLFYRDINKETRGLIRESIIHHNGAIDSLQQLIIVYSSICIYRFFERVTYPYNMSTTHSLIFVLHLVSFSYAARREIDDLLRS